MPKHTGMQEMMGSYASVSVYSRDANGSRAAIAEALSEMKQVDELVSHYKPDSEVSQINRAAGEASVHSDPTTLGVLRDALRIGRETNGAFDPTIGPLVTCWGFFSHEPHVPTTEGIERSRALVDYRGLQIDEEAMTAGLRLRGMSLDLGGIAKGYAVDLAAKGLRARGMRSALVNVSGSSFYAVGRPSGEPGWRVAIAHPRDEGAIIGTVLMRDEGLATSSDSEQFFVSDGVRYGHIMDPRSGYPVSNGVVSVTVLAPTGSEADGLATAVFVLGLEEGFGVLDSHDNVEGVVVREDGGGGLSVVASAGLRERFRSAQPDAATFRPRAGALRSAGASR